MAHPFNDKRAHKVERERLSHIVPGHHAGGASDAAEDRAMIKTAIHKHERMMHTAEGGKPKQRADKPHRAAGGRVKHKKAQTNVNVIVGHGGPQGPTPVPVPVRPPGPPMAGPPPGMPPGGPGLAPPGAMPPPGMIPPRARGGQTYAKGGAVKGTKAYVEGVKAGTPVQHTDGKNDGKDINRPKAITFKKGGSVNNESPPLDRDTDTDSAAAPHFEKIKPHRKTGGPIYSPEKAGVLTPHLPGGSGGGKARKVKEARAAKNYHAPAKGVFANGSGR